MRWLDRALLRQFRFIRAASVNSWRRASSSASERALQYKVGEKIQGFTVEQVTALPELFLTAVKLSHDDTGAKYLHLAREDSENYFSVQFRTTPMDSTGAPHVLEHTVLNGSEKYPCWDIFFKMQSRSLATFMNALTASDYTQYPFSTQNSKDFQNLLSVYLDAAFFPALRELDFWQEGWRLEHENPADVHSPLIFKGIVFNEMKGDFTNSEKLFVQKLQNKLLPDNTYAVISGGDPKYIPDLTWEQLKQFHASHYHPSNARFLTYGNFPLDLHLKYIQENALNRFQKIDPHTAIPSQKRWSEPREYNMTCGVDSLAADPAKQTTVSISFLLADITDISEAFTLSLLSSLLTSGPNSAFYKALIDANIGTGFSPDTGYNESTKEAYFSVGLEGIALKDVETVKQIITKTIDEVIEKGFEEERIEAILHRIEIGLKFQTTGFGFVLASLIASCWNQDGDPVDLLKIGDQITTFRQSLKKNSNFLQEKVKQYLKDNPHRLTLTMSPDETYYVKEAQDEEAKLKQKVNALSEAEKKEIYEKGLELISHQNSPPDASCLPSLKVSEIEPKIQYPKVEIAMAAGDIPVQYCAQPTNGIIYFRALSSLNTVPEELKPYVPLFCSVLTKMGAGVYDYRKLAQQIELRTGGMSVGPMIIPDYSNLDAYEQGVIFSSYCLERNLPDMMHLWREIFNEPHFEDEGRLGVLVRMRAQDLSSGISEMGHKYATVRSSRTLIASGDIQEVFNGMEQVKLMQKTAEASEMKVILRKLSQIKQHILNGDNMRCAVNAGPQQMSGASKEIEQFLKGIHRSGKKQKAVQFRMIEKSLPFGSKTGHSNITRKLTTDPTFKPCQMKTHFSFPYTVNYVAECIRAVPFISQDFARLMILAQLMTDKFLLREVREKGGAYSAGATLTQDGTFNFYSYRDPNSLVTLSSFEQAIEWAKAGKFTQEDIDEAKLSVFSSVDAPISPTSKGIRQFLNGISGEMKQKQREQLFEVNHKNLTDVANKYLALGQSTKGIAIVGPENASIAKDPTWIKQ
uniref:Presequence protease, mitochondrial n=1 Tax=Geotrypetes seraphini TaxID=260995 RepID=A0A6P8QKZ6_GEOSA|nr:presequence protease, mitochondrial [Geotrypetes seraphini]